MARDHPQLNFRIPPDLLEWLRNQATAARRTLTSELIVAIEEHRDRVQQAQRRADSGFQMALCVTESEARAIQAQRAGDGYCAPPSSRSR